MSSHLPPRPSLRQLKSRAKDLRRAAAVRDPEALRRLRQHHPRCAGAGDEQLAAATLQDAQLVVAREHGFDSWPKLAAAVEPAAAATVTAGIVGHSPAAAALRQALARAATHDLPVLLAGEGGVGKRFAARLIHEQGPRADGPFAQMSCDAEVETLAESELFGHEPGAFTGARAARRGKLEEADGGTLLLDEVGALSPLAQRGLIAWLDDGVYRRLGGEQDLRADARPVATTSRDLRALVESGRFRADLYYRLAGSRLELPPLRERVEDIPDLARHFAAGVGPATGAAPSFTEAALALLAAHPWPGNLRQLRHAVEGAAVVVTDGAIDAGDMLLDLASAAHPA